MQVFFGKPEDIDEWMRLVRSVRTEFPGLETKTALDEHRLTVLKFMSRSQAICVKVQERITAVLLFSRSRNMICFLATAPGFRRKGAAAALMQTALAELDRTRDICVSTFREGDEKGTAPRALYKKFGFAEDKLTVEFDYPNQVFILKGNK